LRRLTASEFSASIADLVDPMVPVAQVFNDSRVLGFTVDSSTLRVQDLNADQLMTNAEAVATWAVGSKLQQLQQLATCSAFSADCAKNFVKNFGRKAFRQPLDQARIDSYSALFMAETSFADGASSVITAMLQSPYFLYRSEVGGGTATNSMINLTPFEVATSLSYLLTGSTPDDALLQAAESVTAGDDNAMRTLVDAQSARLLALPASQNAVMGFMSGWLGLDRLYTNVKDDKTQVLTDVQRDDMAAQTKKFILDIWGASANNGVADLFSHESGILAQQSILIGYARADLSSPTQRGHLVRSRILCQDVAPPPAGLDTKFSINQTFTTTRDQYLKGHAAPDHQPCYGCHVLMDPIGVAFEHYDAFGNYRTDEKGTPIDATGTIYSAGTSGVDVAIDGLSGEKGLQTYLAQSADVKSCLVRYWSYYAFGTAGWDQDKCTYDTIRSEAAADAYSLQSVLKAITHTARFTKRVAD